MKKGFVLDDDRLKRLGGGNYFEELLARIRDIRASEKVLYKDVLYTLYIQRKPLLEQIRGIIYANCHMPGGYPLEDHLACKPLLCLHCHLPWPECNTNT